MRYATPYARRWYYRPANFTGAPMRGNYWFERMKQNGGKDAILPGSGQTYGRERQMTVSESIIRWLYGFGDIEAGDRIETDQLDGEAGSYGLYKQPTKDVVPFVDGSRDVTEYYYLLARQSSKAEASRVDNQAWMESLESWVRQKSRSGDLPAAGRREKLPLPSVCPSAHICPALPRAAHRNIRSQYLSTIRRYELWQKSCGT